MRKPTKKSKKWNSIHEHNINKRKHRKADRLRIQDHLSYIDSSPTEKPKRVQHRYRIPGIQERLTHIPCPENLSLEDNFDEVTKLLDSIRAQSKIKKKAIYVDFRPIQRITPSGALVLVAEMDRASRLRVDRRLRNVDTPQWNPTVRRLLKEMGFFDLLRVPNPTEEDELTESDDRYVKFRSGSIVRGEDVDALRKIDLDPHVAVPKNKRLFSAVTEAMTNVRQHAYDSDNLHSTAPQFWWLSASFNKAKGELRIMIYDQGVGIHQTLPRTSGEYLRTRFPDAIFGDHARLIEAAHELPRSRTEERHRGRGFQRDIRGYIASLDKGQGIYTIMSGKGKYTVESGADGQTSRRSFSSALKGTFIQWRIRARNE